MTSVRLRRWYTRPRRYLICRCYYTSRGKQWGPQSGVSIIGTHNHTINLSFDRHANSNVEQADDKGKQDADVFDSLPTSLVAICIIRYEELPFEGVTHSRPPSARSSSGLDALHTLFHTALLLQIMQLLLRWALLLASQAYNQRWRPMTTGLDGALSSYSWVSEMSRVRYIFESLTRGAFSTFCL